MYEFELPQKYSEFMTLFCLLVIVWQLDKVIKRLEISNELLVNILKRRGK
jgi:hypothetical protein